MRIPRRFRGRELREEIEFHCEQLRAEGLDGRAVARAFGSELAIRERAREAWGGLWLAQLGQDVRHALRGFRRTPGSTAGAVLILALGLGAGTALFSVFSAVLVHPLPFARPEQLVLVENVNPLAFNPTRNLEDLVGRYQPWTREPIRGVAGVGFYFFGDAKFSFGPGSGLAPVQWRAAEVSPGFLHLLGVELLGQGLRGGDDQVGRDHVVVLGAGAARAWGSPAAALGRNVWINGTPYRVVGVAPPGFDFPAGGSPTEAWIPLPQPWRWARDALATNTFGLNIIARMRTGATPAAVARAWPTSDRRTGPVTVTQLQQRLTRNEAPGLWMLLAAVGMVFLIACANVANLQLVRALRRRRELEIRAALGASRGRLARQQVAESLALALPAALLAWAAAALALPALRALVPASLRLAAPITLDGRVLAFAVALTAVGVALVGLAPAMHILRGPARPRRQLARSALAAAEVALAAVLLAGAGLLLQSLWRLSRVPLGFAPGGVVAAKLSLNGSRYKTLEERARFTAALQQRVAALPGVAAAALGDNLPLSLGSTFEADTAANGRKALAYYTSVTPGYFRALGISMLAGRDFTAADRQGAPRVVIVSRSLAEALWPGENPVGRHIPNGMDPKRFPPATVVGEAADTHLELSDPATVLYSPVAQAAPAAVALVVRAATGDPAALVPALRQAVAAVDPDEPVAHIATMRALVRAALAGSRFRSILIGLFAGLALLLSVAGLGAVLSYSTAASSGEFGIRLALGAAPGSIARLILRQSLVITALGLAFGTAAALALGRLLAGLLYGVSPHDVVTLAATAAVLGVAALGAAFVPARRAAGMDPLASLKSE